MNTEMASSLGSYHKNELYVSFPQLLVWNPVLYVSGVVLLHHFLEVNFMTCCQMLPNIWYVSQPLNTLDDFMNRFIPSSGTEFLGCGHKMKASTASSVPYL